MAGTVAEWYEFFLYGTASALVFGQLFFRQTDSPIDAFALYAVGFLARPLGGLVFGHYGDKFGRKRLLQLSLVVVGITTFLPRAVDRHHPAQQVPQLDTDRLVPCRRRADIHRCRRPDPGNPR